MRKQNFRNGNTKVTIYGTIEGQYNINKMKFTDSLRSLLNEKNIWIKPDFYSTRVINSPGFFTLLHPKLTNKQAFTTYITKAMKDTSIDRKEQVYLDWLGMERKVDNITTPVPTFYLETTIKKWGNLQVEVVSLHCSSTDAPYMKYLLAEASSQDKIGKGVFVSSGIRLMEGKQILTQILKEQNEFTKDIESFQIEGISENDMYTNNPGQENIEQILINGPGVQSVEPTYQTAYKGQWTLVVKGRKTHQLTEYIKTNISKIYKNKRCQQQKLVVHQTDKNTQGYKLSFVEKMVNRVGTYAKVLSRRFNVPNTADQSKRHNSLTMKKMNKMETSPAATRRSIHMRPNIVQKNNLPTATSTQSTKIREAEGNQTTEVHVGDNISASSLSDENSNYSKGQRQEQSSAKVIENNLHGFSNTEVQEWNRKIHLVQTIFISRMALFEQKHKQLMQKLEDKVEEQVDSIMEKRLKNISNVVGNAVTSKVMEAMERMFQRSRARESETISDRLETTVTQDSPCKADEQYRNIKGKCRQTEISILQTKDNTKLMLAELANIENKTTNPTDPTHDINNQGSSLDKS